MYCNVNFLGIYFYGIGMSIIEMSMAKFKEMKLEYPPFSKENMQYQYREMKCKIFISYLRREYSK